MSRRTGSEPKGYSVIQVTLHWTIAALVIFQLLVNGGMQDAFNDRMDGEMVEDSGWAVLHIAVGATVLMLAFVRVFVRLTQGAPPGHPGRPAAFGLLGVATHLALYGFIFAMPVTGAVAWFGRSDLSAELHELGRLVLVPLIVLHVAGAFVEHFLLGNDTLLRMLKPERDGMKRDD